ncbi:MAG: hypothetical protein R3E92_24440 [Burkholderiaceae bacterium]
MSKQPLRRPTNALPAAARRVVDAELLEAATAAEPGPRAWVGEFRWLLGHAAIAPLAATEPDAPLSLGAIAGQYAACFPRVSADEDWLAGRSMAVLAGGYVDERPGFEAMFFDGLIVRPLGLGATVLGAATWVVTLPFSALGGNVGEATEKLVADPARFTFTRPLGEL